MATAHIPHPPLIVLLDDNQHDLDLNVRSLKRSGLQAEFCCFTEASEAVVFLESTLDQGRVPSLMIMDLKMPRISGLDMLRILREKQLKQFPVVVMSGSHLEENTAEALQLGADACYEKPMKFKDSHRIFAQIAQQFVSIST